MKIKYYFIIIILAVLSFSISSCDKNRIYEKNQDVQNHIWNKDSIFCFNVEITDTITPCNLYINSRITSQYPKNNLYLFITTHFPYKDKMHDTLACVLADKSGKWYGKGFGDVWSFQIPYKKNVIFPHPGIYTFEVEQAMRTVNLPNVLDVGLRVEKIK
ncbi:MAG: gliding motility lipoprotein GldH [Bacteroidales bacterium]|nr:gliding motility lipoprotein GldH [Bacteroidales bacterium]